MSAAVEVEEVSATVEVEVGLHGGGGRGECHGGCGRGGSVLAEQSCASYPSHTYSLINCGLEIMELVCSLTHKKPVCYRCNAGTNCTKCCLCQPRTRGRPRKLDESETPHRVNPEREARCFRADAVSLGALETGIHVSGLCMEGGQE